MTFEPPSNDRGPDGNDRGPDGEDPAPDGRDPDRDGKDPDANAGPRPALPHLPERRPLNTSGWIALALAIVAFGGSVLVAWPPAILLAALALALGLTGVIRVYRGRATNRAAAFTALGLALATIMLGFVWAERAQPCTPLTGNTERFNTCYENHTGLL